jgi:hypothetical protein
VLFIIVDTGQHYKFTYKHVTDSGQEALFEWAKVLERQGLSPWNI